MSKLGNRLDEYWKTHPACKGDEDESEWFHVKDVAPFVETRFSAASKGGSPDPSFVKDAGTLQQANFQEALTTLLKKTFARQIDSPGPALESLVVPITSLAPEPYRLISPVMAVLQGNDGDYTASFFDANIGSSGETQQEAIDNLKELLIMSFESLADDDDNSLGPQMRRQKAVLSSFITRA